MTRLRCAQLIYVLFIVALSGCPTKRIDLRAKAALHDGGSDASVCGVCSDTRPVCNARSQQCVQCLNDSHCTDNSRGNECNEASGTCVCNVQADCPDPLKPTCNVEKHRCIEGCEDDGDCSHLFVYPYCKFDRCIQCRLDAGSNEEGVCDDPGVNQGCDLATGLCSGIPRDSVDTCGACVADSECKNADHYCVPMFFQGEALEGGFCLLNGDGGCSEAPFTVPTEQRESFSGVKGNQYCGVDEAVTTCVAVQQLINNDFSQQQCTPENEADACGIAGLSDGRCESVNLNANQCTYGCSTPAQCPSGYSCNNGYCGG